MLNKSTSYWNFTYKVLLVYCISHLDERLHECETLHVQVIMRAVWAFWHFVVACSRQVAHIFLVVFTGLGGCIILHTIATVLVEQTLKIFVYTYTSCRIFKRNEAKTRVAWGRLVAHWQNWTLNMQMESKYLYMMYASQFSGCVGLRLFWSSEAGKIVDIINIVQFCRPLNCPSSMLKRWPPKGFQRYQILNFNLVWYI